MSETSGDPGLSRTDYECGAGKLREWGVMTDYRITAR
jgi:hypothetical protein